MKVALRGSIGGVGEKLAVAKDTLVKSVTNFVCSGPPH
jgi:hypothetical protein